MKRSTLVVFAVLLALTVGLVACGGGEKSTPTPAPQATVKAQATTETGPATREAQPTKVMPTATAAKPTPVPPTVAPTPTKMMEKPAPTSVPTEAATEGGEAGQEGELEYKLPDELQDVKSYRMHMIYKTTLNGQALEVFHYLVEAVRDPEAKHILMKSLQALPEQGEEPKYQTIEMIQKEGKLWLNLGGTWMTGQDEGDTGYGEELQLYSPDEMGSNWKKVGTETVNGQKAIHYRTTTVTSDLLQAPIASYWATWHQGEEAPQFKVKKVEADVYINDKGLVVKEDIRWTVELTQQGKTQEAQDEMILEITDMNADITIEVPEEAQSSAKPPIPLPGEATQAMSMGDLYIYEIADKSVEEVTAYFQQELPKQGYKLEGQGVPGIFKVTTPEGDVYTVTVTEGDAGGAQIMIQKGG